MQSEADELVVNYFVLCDNVISEAGTGKQSIIGAYSALMTEQVPTMANLAVAFGFRTQSERQREIKFRLTGPNGKNVLETPALPFDWNSAKANLKSSGFATLQIGLNLRGVPFETNGVYTAAIYCDGDVLANFPLSVMPVPAGGPPGAPRLPNG